MMVINDSFDYQVETTGIQGRSDSRDSVGAFVPTAHALSSQSESVHTSSSCTHTQRIDLRVSETELANWKRLAKEAGVGLSEWIRRRCNGPGAISLKLAEDRGLTTLPKTVHTKQKTAKACVHGTEKGFNCWQCGGVAKVE